MLISFFRRASRFGGVSGHWHSNKENPSCFPVLSLKRPQIMRICISFQSNSGCWPCLGFFVSYLVLQACISVCSVSNKSGASLFLPCSHKNAVALIYIYIHKYIYIYIYAVGSIGWPHFGHFKVNNLATFFEPIKKGFFWDFLCTIFRGWCKISVFERCFWSKKRFPKKNVHHFWGSLGFTSLLLHDVTRCFRRVCKKLYKNRFFVEHPLARCRRNRKRRKKRPKKK